MVDQKGVLKYEYYEGRKKNLALKYRLARRTKEVLKGIEEYNRHKLDSLLDIGTADARMLEMLNNELSVQNAVGIDFSADLLHTNPNKDLFLVQADAVTLPFKNNSFDVLVAMAVIEHVTDPSQMMRECWRVIRDEGICILSTPDPFFEHIATKIGHLKEDQHNETFSLSNLKSLVERAGFHIVLAEKFMISPIGFPFEDGIERVMRIVGLDFLLLNQLLIGKKSEQ
jgi:ubiquinone/menaquinone biosynthesis C-methylase UbiE